MDYLPYQRKGHLQTKMDRTELVMELVFENNETFKNMTKDTCKLLLNTSCSMTMKNTNIKQTLKQIQAHYERKNLCNEIYKVFENIIELSITQYNLSECD